MILNAKNFELWTIDQGMGTADPALKDVEAKGDDYNYNSLDNNPRDLEWMPGGLYNDS